MPSKKVIDVSSYNGTIDWGRVAREGDVDGVGIFPTIVPVLSEKYF